MKFRFLTLIILLATLLVTPPHINAASNPSDSIAELIQTDADGKPTAMCTTFSTVSQGEVVWVTAGHCVQNDETKAIVMEGYRIGDESAHVISANIPVDLAMLKGGPNKSRLMLANKPAQVKDVVQTLGYPIFFTDPMYRSGVVSHASFKAPGWPKAMMIINLPTANGDSGAPVLNGKDELVGMVTGGFCRLANPFGLPVNYEGFCPVSVGVSQETLVEFLTTRK